MGIIIFGSIPDNDFDDLNEVSDVDAAAFALFLEVRMDEARRRFTQHIVGDEYHVRDVHITVSVGIAVQT